MTHRLGRSMLNRMLNVVVASALVWALLLVVEHQGGAQAQTRPSTHAAAAHFADPGKAIAAAQAAVVNPATAQRAAADAIAQAQQATQQLTKAPLLPGVLAVVCAALLRARALLVALGRAGAPGLAIVDRLIARFGCSNISSAPPPPPRCTRTASPAGRGVADIRQVADAVRLLGIQLDPAAENTLVAAADLAAPSVGTITQSCKNPCPSTATITPATQTIAVGQTGTVTVTVQSEDLTFFNDLRVRLVAAGTFTDTLLDEVLVTPPDSVATNGKCISVTVVFTIGAKKGTLRGCNIYGNKGTDGTTANLAVEFGVGGSNVGSAKATCSNP